VIDAQGGAAEALQILAKWIAHFMLEGQRAHQAGMLDQKTSQLGSRTHIALVRRLVAAGSPDAAIVGRSFLATREAVDAELAAISKRSKNKKPAERDQLAPLRAKYGLSRVAS